MSSRRQGVPLMAYSLSPDRNRVRVMVISARSAGQLAGAVVDGEGLTSARPRAGRLAVPAKMTSSIFGRPHGARPLGTEHPGHGVDDVGLAAAVRAHHHGDPRFEFEHGRIGEGLESLEGEGLQEHRALTLPVERGPRGSDGTAIAEVRPGSARRSRSTGPPDFTRTMVARHRRQAWPSRS